MDVVYTTYWIFCTQHILCCVAALQCYGDYIANSNLTLQEKITIVPKTRKEMSIFYTFFFIYTVNHYQNNLLFQVFLRTSIGKSILYKLFKMDQKFRSGYLLF